MLAGGFNGAQFTKAETDAAPQFRDELEKEFARNAKCSAIGWGVGKALGPIARKAGCMSKACKEAVRKYRGLPLGRGSTGRIVPLNLKEKLRMEEVMSNPVKHGIPATSKPMGDPRWPASEGWVKMRNADNTIHWVQNLRTGAVDDFKFKD